MTPPLRNALAAEPRLVLICQSCCYAWEPLGRRWTPADVQAMAGGCPECGDWLYMGELAHPDAPSGPRRAVT